MNAMTASYTFHDDPPSHMAREQRLREAYYAGRQARKDGKSLVATGRHLHDYDEWVAHMTGYLDENEEIHQKLMREMFNEPTRQGVA